MACLIPALFPFMTLLVPNQVPQVEPIPLGSRRELFVDDFLIDRLEGAKLDLKKPIPREVAIVHDAPWEGNTSAYHTVFRDGNIVRMYYRGSHFDKESKEDPHPQWVCYAESYDGITWTKPHLNLFEYDGSKKNNIVWTGTGSHNFAPFKDPNAEAGEDALYKALGSGDGGLYAFQSKDGIHWSLLQETPVITEGAFDSQNLAFWDELRGRYVDFHRGFRDGVRDIMTCTSEDFLHWTDPEWLDITGAPREHLYTNQIQPYFRAPHIFMGFPKRFVPSRQVVEDVQPGVSDGVFMTSRDGLHFHRWGEAFIRPGLQKERWVNRNNMTACGILVTPSHIPGTPDELSLYSSEGYYKGPGARMKRFTLRMDGFVSVNAPMAGGELVTQPVVFDPPAQDAPSKEPVGEGPCSLEQDEVILGNSSLRVKRAMSFSIPNTQDLGPSVTLAVACKHLPKGHRRLFSAYNGGPTTPKELYFDVGTEKGDLRFGYDTIQVLAEGILASIWEGDEEESHHFAVTWDKGHVTLYLDGAVVAEGGEEDRNELRLALGDLRFGEDYPPTSEVNEPFLGLCDDILVLRRALAPEEMRSLAEKGAEKALNLQEQEGVLYTMESETGQGLQDALKKDGEQTAQLPGPVIPGQVELLLNYSTSAAGSILCELQEQDGSPIPGFTLEDCDTIFGDHIERRVSWKGLSEMKELAGHPIRLRFQMKDADLYAIQFK